MIISYHYVKNVVIVIIIMCFIYVLNLPVGVFLTSNLNAKICNKKHWNRLDLLMI